MKVVSNYINEYLNPSKHNFYDVQIEDYIEPNPVEEIWDMLDINVDVYYRSLEISDDNDFQVHLGWAQDSCFVNNCCRVGLVGLQIFQRNNLEHYDLRRRLLTYLMIVTIPL